MAVVADKRRERASRYTRSMRPSPRAAPSFRSEGGCIALPSELSPTHIHAPAAAAAAIDAATINPARCVVWEYMYDAFQGRAPTRAERVPVTVLAAGPSTPPRRARMVIFLLRAGVGLAPGAVISTLRTTIVFWVGFWSSGKSDYDVQRWVSTVRGSRALISAHAFALFSKLMRPITFSFVVPKKEVSLINFENNCKLAAGRRAGRGGSAGKQSDDDGAGTALGGGVCAVLSLEREASVRRINAKLCSLARAQHHRAHPRALGHEQHRLPPADGARAVVHGGVVQEVWEGDEAYRLSRRRWRSLGSGMRRESPSLPRLGMTRPQTGRRPADHRLHVGVGEDGERADDASRSTDEKSDGTTPQERPTSPRVVCVGVGIPAKPLRLVAGRRQAAESARCAGALAKSPACTTRRAARLGHRAPRPLRLGTVTAAAQGARAKSARPGRAHPACPPLPLGHGRGRSARRRSQVPRAYLFPYLLARLSTAAYLLVNLRIEWSSHTSAAIGLIHSCLENW
ncbi:hypothetical protein FB451DRAFT_1437402 [Mycena latifolia]|nr:hypothetical protein FB451DRAFT_1437402 [Mycena latifolia]